MHMSATTIIVCLTACRGKNKQKKKKKCLNSGSEI